MTDWTHTPVIKPSLTLGLAAAAAIVGVGALVREAPGVFGALVAPFARSDEVDPLEKYLKEHDSLADMSRKRLEGRYVFFAPKAPVRPPPPAPPVDPNPPPPPPPPKQPAPANYDGPKPRGLLGDIVFFDDAKVKVGEKHGDIELLDAGGPFSIKIAWTKSGHERGEYVVSTWGDMPKGFDSKSTNPFPKSTAGFNTGGKAGDAKAGGGEGKPGAESGDGTPAAGGNPAAIRRGGAAIGPDGKPIEQNPPAEGGAASPESNPAVNPPAQGEGAPPPQTQPANQPGKQEAANEGKPIDYVPLEKLPPFRTEQYIKGMAKDAAQVALDEINQALALPNVDDHNRARLEQDAKLLTDRIRSDT